MEKINFKKKFGQNFISDKNLLSAIASDAQVSAEDEILEIGAGAGSLTQVLSQRAKKVVSYEIDKDLTDILQNLNLPNVEFVFCDFMKCEMQEIEQKFDKKFKVVANLPYYITTPIIFKLLEESKKLESLTIMVQKEVAERICANPGGKDYGILSVMVNFYGKPKITRIINRNMFFPAPNVDSALVNIEIEPKFDVDRIAFSKFVKACFSMRRKTLLNNLSTIFDKQKLKNVLSEEILKSRAEVLSLVQLIEIFKMLQK